MAATATRQAETALASMTRPRCGTRVKVVSPLRWLHSAVTDRTVMMARMIDIGMPIARVNWL